MIGFYWLWNLLILLGTQSALFPYSFHLLTMFLWVLLSKMLLCYTPLLECTFFLTPLSTIFFYCYCRLLCNSLLLLLVLHFLPPNIFLFLAAFETLFSCYFSFLLFLFWLTPFHISHFQAPCLLQKHRICHCYCWRFRWFHCVFFAKIRN